MTLFCSLQGITLIDVADTQAVDGYIPVTKATHTAAQISTGLIFGINDCLNIDLWQSLSHQVTQILSKLIVDTKSVFAALDQR
jgi:hypothetical protein